ncbi:MAG: divergent polysaccharide deacetylase family protein [Candidatus Omnitrophica bacterium]|nr:divergent polysaccharide deacetylase family protein [Candidatus Omnitrophota bacterium]
MNKARWWAAGLFALAGLLWIFWYAFGPIRPAKQTPVPRETPPARVEEAAGPAFARGKGRIAIVLDDWGYGAGQLPYLRKIRTPLTVAVLPNLPYSAAAAKEAHANGHAVILHLPMEPLGSAEPREAATLLTGMTDEEAVDFLEKSLASVPFARGVNNHQGSKATADSRLMTALLKEIKRRGLFFLDSFVTDQSVCAEAAREARVRFARRSVFLDNDPAASEILKSLSRLAEIAAREGQAIGIGHDRPSTLKVLEAACPALRRAGYRLVHASDLAETPRR